MVVLFALAFFCFLACSACTVAPSADASQLASFYHQTAVPLATVPDSANVSLPIFPVFVHKSVCPLHLDALFEKNLKLFSFSP